jgi:hypothetical protein
MPVMMERLYDALRAAHVPDEQARAAAVEAAEHESRFAAIETKLAELEARVSTLTWVVGINIALTTAVLAKLLTLR